MAGDVPGLDPHATTSIVGWLSGLATATIGAFGLWMAQRVLGKAAFEQAMTTRFQALMASSEAFHAEQRASWHEERLQMRGKIINLEQSVATLTNALRQQGVTGLPETKHPDPIIIVEPDSEP